MDNLLPNEIGIENSDNSVETLTTEEVFKTYQLPYEENNTNLSEAKKRAYKIIQEIYGGDADRFHSQIYWLLNWADPSELQVFIDQTGGEEYSLKVKIEDVIPNIRNDIEGLLERLGIISTTGKKTVVLGCTICENRINQLPPQEIIALWNEATKAKLKKHIIRLNAYIDRQDEDGQDIERKEIHKLMKNLKQIHSKYGETVQCA
ncbi:MAG: hypothetical protein KAS32_08550 [Candidatus Peribacteraceae bacterium]|nr:hypothetical protein [Candidatus Peribacteraceae bacterium]